MTGRINRSVLDPLVPIGALPDEKIDLAETSLLIAAISHPGLSLDRYRNHIKKLVDDARALEKPDASLEDRVALLKSVIIDNGGYAGDSENYNDLQNADLIRVIDRRKGLPITLSILFIHVGRALGWSVDGLNFPGHFVVRLDRSGERVIIDPFNGGSVLQAPDLRRMVKKALGPEAELSATYYNPASNRAILIRLQNNIKIRQIEGEDYAGALNTVEVMRVIDPDEFRLKLDAGVLYARTGEPQAAIEALEAYIAIAPSAEDRFEAAALLQHIRQTLN